MTTLEINNKTVESFLSEQANKNNVSTTEYLVGLVMTEIETATVKNDMRVLESEINKVNSGGIKLNSAHLLLNDL